MYLFLYRAIVLVCITGEGVKLQDCGPKVGACTSYKGTQITEADLSGQQNSHTSHFREDQFHMNKQHKITVVYHCH